jgi:Cu+-exporting ATPase
MKMAKKMNVFLAWGLGVGLSGSLLAAEQKATIKVYGMTCQMCANGVAGSVNNLKGVKNAEVSVKEGEAVVLYDDAQVTVDQIKRQIDKIGFSTNPKSK